MEINSKNSYKAACTCVRKENEFDDDEDDDDNDNDDGDSDSVLMNFNDCIFPTYSLCETLFALLNERFKIIQTT